MSFDGNVLELAKKIPRGKVSTYREIARALNTRAYRAVGQALRRNPNPITVPCHRVVRSDGCVGGYAGKISSGKKVRLLREEGVAVIRGRVDLGKCGFRFR